MDLLALAFTLLFPLVPTVSLWAIVRYGPVRSRWHQHENALGFALFVGGIAFSIGFFGPMVFTPGANQGPMLGIFITGPIGLMVGVVWGVARAMRRGHGADQPGEV